MIRRNKKNARHLATHTQDAYTDLGYDYRETVFLNSVSKPILENSRNKGILNAIQKLIVFLIDAVKQIRLQFMISLNKNDRNLN